MNRNTLYTVTITKGLMDISGTSISADKEWHFTTVV
ncbi:MAG: Ig-like domain-containing protein [Nitrososphaeraceae archaeon]